MARHRRTGPWHGADAVAALLSSASAQLLGYASNAPTPFPSDNMMVAPAQPADDGDDSTAVVPQRLKRAIVAFDSHEAPGTIVIDTGNTYLYYVLGQGRAVRYGVGVGREGFTWSGVQTVTRKAEWPDWHPPAEMVARQPYLPRFMAGGPGNPLGARGCISAPASTGFTVPTIPPPSASSFPRAAFA